VRAPGRAFIEREPGVTPLDFDKPIRPALRVSRLRRRESIPQPIAAEIIAFGKRLAESFASFFVASPRLKFSASRLFETQLPPLPQPRGRPGYKQVTDAIRLRENLRPSEPDSRRMWTQICIGVIPNYQSLDKPEQREVRAELRQRVKWRLRARVRRRRGGKFSA
jgi:hypothetical protein